MNLLRRLLMLIAGLTLAALLAVRHAAPSSQAEVQYFFYTQGTNQRYVGELGLARADGRHRTVLTEYNAHQVGWMKLSPDGEWFYFYDRPPGDTWHEVFRIRPDGTGRQRITHNDAIENFFSFSPDGQWIYYTSGTSSAPFQTYLMRTTLDGSRHEHLATGDGIPGYSNYHSWSDDGEWIFYTLHSGDSISLYRMRPDGTEQRRLTRPSIWAYAVFSPTEGPWRYLWDENSLRFYRVSAEGGSLQRLVTPHRVVRFPQATLSPDQRWLALGGDSHLLLYRVDGPYPHLQPATHINLSTYYHSFLHWTPDSRWLIAGMHTPHQTASEAQTVVRFDPVTGAQQNLTPNFVNAYLRELSPDGKWAIFGGTYAHQQPNYELHGLYRVRLEADAQGNFAVEQIGSKEYLSPVTWSPDGKWLYCRLSDQGQPGRALFRYDIDNGRLENLTDTLAAVSIVDWLTLRLDEETHVSALMIGALLLVLGGWVRRLPGVGWATGWLGRRDSSSGEMD